MTPEETNCQNFVLNLDYGEHLFTLYPTPCNSEKILKLENGRIISGQARLGHQTIVPHCKAAPNETTFMMAPQDDDATFYLGLNNYVNSLRLSEDEQLIKSDLTLDTLLQKQDNDGKIVFHVSNYCLSLLARSVLTKIKNRVMRKDFEKQNSAFQQICHEFVEKNLEFLRMIKEHNSNQPEDSRKKTIQDKEYISYIKALKNHFERERPKNFDHAYALNKFWRTLLEGIIGGTFDKNLLESIFREQGLDLPCGEEILELLGETNTIIKNCLKNYNEKDYSGHMTIVRMMKMNTNHGNIMKQSLCIARHVSESYNLEIIQDYSAKGTLSTKLNHHVETAIQDAKDHNNPCFLRILKKIQVNRCQERDSNGILTCDCLTYSQDTEDPYNLRCKNCNHFHRSFKSYSDLIGLPCLLILVNNGAMGDTFPPSLCAIDDRVSNITINSTIGAKPYLSDFAQEKGRLCRYTTLNSMLPIMYVSEKLRFQFQRSLKFDASYYHYFADKKSVDSKIRFKDHDFEAIKDHYDTIEIKKERNNHFLLIAEPQCGKTGVYLQVNAASFLKGFDFLSNVMYNCFLSVDQSCETGN